MSNRLVFPVVVFAALVALTGCVVPPPPLPGAVRSATPTQFEIAALADSLLIGPLEEAGASVALVVGELDGSEPWVAYEADRLRLPASVQKLFVAADVLLRFAPEDRLITELYGSGPLDENGVLHGDLVIRGGWDPSLSGDHPYSDWPWDTFDGFAQDLYDNGLREIRGSIVVEAAAFVPGAWEIGDLDWRYAPRIAGLMWNDGLVSDAQQMAGLLGSTLLTATWPDPVYWTVDHSTRWREGLATITEPDVYAPSNAPVGLPNGVLLGSVAESDTMTDAPGGLPNGVLLGSEGLPDSVVTTTDPTQHPPVGQANSGISDGGIFNGLDVRDRAAEWSSWTFTRRPTPEPRRLAGDALRAALRRLGITGGDSTRVLDPGYPAIPRPAIPSFSLTHPSPALDSLLASMLQVSSNAWAEQLEAAAAERAGAEPGVYTLSWPGVLDSLDLSGGEGLNAADACGMARRNRLRAITVHQLLGAAHQRWGDRWLNLLAVPGMAPSTLENRLPALSGHFLGKTGTLSDCRTLAGYLLDDAGEPVLAVTVFTNQATGNVEPEIDRFVTALAQRLHLVGEE